MGWINKVAVAAIGCIASIAPASAQSPSDGQAPIWTALYAGVHVGGVWGQSEATRPASGSFEERDKALQGGGYIGGMYQVGAFVFGAEADASWIALEDNLSDSLFTSLRGRIGYAIGRTLIYGTVGVAAFEQKMVWTSVATGQVFPAKDTMTGLAIGGGVEYRLRDNLSVRGEVIHYDFGSTVFHAPIGTNWLEVERSNLVARLGVSFLLK